VKYKPDFVLHVGGKGRPKWADVELLFEHTRSSGQETVTEKFLQWLRSAWSVFHYQPFRRHLYGIMFIKPWAYVCYASHSCATYSERLSFVKNSRHAQFLADFLTWFIANPERRGRDPTVEKGLIHHAGTAWAELPNGLLCYRPCLVGRNIRVARVKDQGAKFPEKVMVMKSTWEETFPTVSSPQSEVEVLKILLQAGVRGLPQPYALESAIVRDDRKEFGVRRRLTRVLMSYCVPLMEAMRTHGPKELMQIIRDAMIVYYEAYKQSGFIHGGRRFMNVLCSRC
jgi:Fungal protein kinase